jgi:hypothetical protein
VQVVHIIFSSSKDRKPRNISAKTIFEAATTGKIFLSSYKLHTLEQIFYKNCWFNSGTMYYILATSM